MKHRDEQLSAFLDDALDKQEVREFIQDLKRDPISDGEQLQRYQLIRDVLNDDLDQSSFIDISAAVHRAIEQEVDPTSKRIEPASKPFINISAWLKPISGVALAASVAMVTVVSVRLVNNDSTDPDQPQLVDNQLSKSVQRQTVVPVNQDVLQRIQVVSTADLQKENRLREYLMNHSEYAGQTTIQGMMPYARVVSFDPQARK